MTHKTCATLALVLVGMAGTVHAQVVVRDAETGQWRAPTPAEAAALSPRSPLGSPAAESSSQPIVRSLPHRGIAVTLPESMMSYSVARVGAGGGVERDCVSGKEVADRAVLGPAPFAQPFKLTRTATRAATTTTARGMHYEDK